MLDIEFAFMLYRVLYYMYLPFIHFSIVATEIPIATGSRVLMSLPD